MKSLLILCSSLLLIFLVACSQGGPTTQETTQTDTTQAQTSHEKAKTHVPNLSVSDFEKMREVGVQAIVIDVRTPEEIAKGKIPEALEMDYEAPDFESKIDGLEKEKSYILYCEAGGRSSKAAEMMLQKGFKNVFNLEGGYEAWEKEVAKDK